MLMNCVKRIPSYLRGSVDVFVNLECIHFTFTCIYCISLIPDALIRRITCISLYPDVPIGRITKIHEVVPSVVSRGISTLVLVTRAYITELGLLKHT